MSWSTRELADIAGTTVKAIRHYHAIGLLDEPERRSNGYKQYTTAHLVQLLRIRRLQALGVPLSRVPAMGASAEDPDEAIRMIDAELAATIDRLQRIRLELAAMSGHGAALDVPPDFAPVADRLTANEKALVTIWSHVFDAGATEVVRRAMLDRTSADDDFEALPADADEETIDELAHRLLPGVISARELPSWNDDLVGSAGSSARVIGQALVDLYNPAQIRLMVRLDELANRGATG
ncbi:MerR family transcriptional regulator [Nakamurella sp. YIM 132087]|uniref:MerR family transcriptional regulator n=1 Tax=Nakamurella alba TaxID=2665158 RepID=A0A7K1FE41_9ACTN|nr:MerR family transcriptional regulator [Nakamurella alba]MTD12358.1 MerR family transcriptional regulator [Nakamurella alba]